MLSIIACYKWVPDEQDIKIVPETLRVDRERAKYKISEYDRNAIEAAVQTAEKEGGEVTALTFGNAKAKPSLKDALSRGVAKACWVPDDLADQADAFVTSQVLAAAVRKIGAYDLIVCGEGAGDTYARQVGPRVAALLDIPAITYVCQMHLEGDIVHAVRRLDGCTEVQTAKLPVLISVLPELNQPRTPSLKQILGAAKKPVTEFKLADLEMDAPQLVPKAILKRLQGYAMTRKNMVLKEGTTKEKVDLLVGYIMKENLL